MKHTKNPKKGIHVQLIPALTDNYIACIINSANRCCVVVDPGDANPVINFINQEKLTLSAILITHHHWDHTQGIAGLLAKISVPVYGPEKEDIPCITHRLKAGDQVNLTKIPLSLKVLDVPGHTLGHIAYYNDQWLFCGDTLFTGGCGKLFEGSAAQLYASLSQLATLAEETLVYCGHEYTTANLAFAQQVEPNNVALQHRIQVVHQQRQQHLPTVPETLAIEKQTNPFLRCTFPEVVKAAEQRAGKTLPSPEVVFEVIRAWKNIYKTLNHLT